jgi:hypothetical protein
MDYQIGTVTYDLRELPPSLHARIEEKPVRAALTEYLEAYTADKVAIDEHDAFDCADWDFTTNDMKILRAHWAKTGELRRTCTQTRQRRKRAWFALLDLLGEDYDYTSTDEEDLN